MKNLLSILAIFALAALPLPAQDSTITTRNVYAYAGVPASGTNELNTITIGGTPTAGTFTITIAGGRTTAPITWSATNATLLARVDAALEALSVIGVGGVTTADSTLASGIGDLTVTLAGKNARQDFAAMSVTSSLTGTSPTLAIANTTPGVVATYPSAPAGTLLVDTTNRVLYQNSSATVNSPTWTAVGNSLALDTSAELRTLVTDETGTGVLVFATAPTFTTSLQIGAAGVKLSDDGDGALTLLGVGNGTDEDLTLNLDDVSNTGTFTSSTGLATLDFSGIALTGPTVTMTGAIRTTSATLPIGYNAGAGFAVTQLTNKQTTVVSDTPAGVITMNNESLVNDTETTFQVTCASCAAIDVPMVAIASVGTAGKYLVSVSAVAAGSFKITVSNVGTTAGEAIVLNYAILKGAAN